MIVNVLYYKPLNPFHISTAYVTPIYMHSISLCFSKLNFVIIHMLGPFNLLTVEEVSVCQSY